MWNPNPDTIAAISTAPGSSAIAVLRMSGEKSTKIIEYIFSASPHSEKSPLKTGTPNLKVQHAHHGFLIDPENGCIVDEVVITIFRSPRSYTGEDMVEISAHGSTYTVKEILSLLIRQGARLAQRGEFTQRAFLNGKMDLTQAEAVLDLIQAKTGRQSRLALSIMGGELGSQINAVRSELMAVLTRVVAGLDFPEEIGDAPEPELEAVVKRSSLSLNQLYERSRSGKFLREGLKLALVGRPNAGKSSLLNQLLKYERAIVTDIPGTTRDSLEEIFDLNGIPILLVDTAGIRPTEDLVEKLGIERSIKAMTEADLVLLLADESVGWGDPEEEILRQIGDKAYLLVWNKCDLYPTQSNPKLPLASKPWAELRVSAKSGEHIDKLGRLIENFVFRDGTNSEQVSLNTRQSELCFKAIQSLKLVEETLRNGLPQDCLATDLKGAVDSLSEISGSAVSEELISQVFATFCIGK